MFKTQWQSKICFTLALIHSSTFFNLNSFQQGAPMLQIVQYKIGSQDSTWQTQQTGYPLSFESSYHVIWWSKEEVTFKMLKSILFPQIMKIIFMTQIIKVYRRLTKYDIFIRFLNTKYIIYVFSKILEQFYSYPSGLGFSVLFFSIGSNLHVRKLKDENKYFLIS